MLVLAAQTSKATWVVGQTVRGHTPRAFIGSLLGFLIPSWLRNTHEVYHSPHLTSDRVLGSRHIILHLAVVNSFSSGLLTVIFDFCIFATPLGAGLVLPLSLTHSLSKTPLSPRATIGPGVAPTRFPGLVFVFFHVKSRRIQKLLWGHVIWNCSTQSQHVVVVVDVCHTLPISTQFTL